jgi:hypothetical protein
MIILVHTAFHAGNVAANLGRPEYSYYFVLREFRPMLEKLGVVIDIRDPAREVDAIYTNCLEHHVPCVFLSFLPPNKTPIGLACPTVPVFAWEYGDLPGESFSGKARNDWRRVLKHVGPWTGRFRSSSRPRRYGTGSRHVSQRTWHRALAQ